MSNRISFSNSSRRFKHGNKFYVDVLGCKLGNREEDKWVDVDFWGNELTLHKTEMKLT